MTSLGQQHARAKPQPRVLYRLKLRDKHEGYCIGEIDHTPAMTSRCNVCGGIGLRFMLKGGYAVLHEIRFVERLLQHGRGAWGSVVLEVSDTCAGGKRNKKVSVTLKEGLGL